MSHLSRFKELYIRGREQEEELLLAKYDKDHPLPSLERPLKSSVEGEKVLSNIGQILVEPDFFAAPSTASTNTGMLKPLTEEEIKSSLEDDLLGLAGRMKSYARNYKEQLTRDNQILGTISKTQNNNIKRTEKEIQVLNEFAKMSNELGFWRLLMMGGIAILMFISTIVFIFFTSFFR